MLEVTFSCFFIHSVFFQFDCLPDWAKKTMSEHKGDERKFIYSTSDLEEGRTHDIYWNAAQFELIYTHKVIDDLLMPNFDLIFFNRKPLKASRFKLPYPERLKTLISYRTLICNMFDKVSFPNIALGLRRTGYVVLTTIQQQFS